HLAGADVHVHTLHDQAPAVGLGEAAGARRRALRGARDQPVVAVATVESAQGRGGSLRPRMIVCVRTCSWPSTRILSSPRWRVNERPSISCSGSFMRTLSPTMVRVPLPGV